MSIFFITPTKTSPHTLNKNSSGYRNWSSFTRRSYFSRDPRIDSSLSEEGSGRNFSSIWICVGIAIIYILILGVLITVLILAPKYPQYVYPVSSPHLPESGTAAISPPLLVPSSQDITFQNQIPLSFYPTAVPGRPSSEILESEPDPGPYYGNPHRIEGEQRPENVGGGPPSRVFEVAILNLPMPFRPSATDPTELDKMDPRSGLEAYEPDEEKELPPRARINSKIFGKHFFPTV